MLATKGNLFVLMFYMADWYTYYQPPTFLNSLFNFLAEVTVPFLEVINKYVIGMSCWLAVKNPVKNFKISQKPI